MPIVNSSIIFKCRVLAVIYSQLYDTGTADDRGGRRGRGRDSPAAGAVHALLQDAVGAEGPDRAGAEAGQGHRGPAASGRHGGLDGAARRPQAHVQRGGRAGDRGQGRAGAGLPGVQEVIQHFINHYSISWQR